MGIFHHDRVGTSDQDEDAQDELEQDNQPDPDDVPESAIWQPQPGSLEDRI